MKKKDDHTEADQKNHFVDFKIPIYLRDISDFFRKLDIIQFAEFQINLKLIDNMLASSRDNIKYTINNAFLYTEEIKLDDIDNIKYLKMIDNKFSKKINFIENHVNIFNGKLTTIIQDFNINNIRNADSVFIYGIIENRESGLNHELPSIKFEYPYINIDNIRFENPIPLDNWAYLALKNKSNHYDNF